MKAILMSIRPQHVVNILNEEKTIEVRKRFPSDYVGWVYIYCTKDQNEELWWYDGTEDFRLYKKGIANEKDIGWHLQNGKVVARFWCDKVEEITFYEEKQFFNDGYEKEPNLIWHDYGTRSVACGLLEEKACLTFEDLHDYLKGQNGKAIHVANIEIFDKPKELKEFKYVCPNVLCDQCKYGNKEIDLSLPICKRQITRAPQSWQFIEVDL